jgi:hypothetical protein
VIMIIVLSIVAAGVVSQLLLDKRLQRIVRNQSRQDTTEDEILQKYSTPGLRRNVLPRHAKKLNMEFDAQFNKMTKADRDAFLDELYPGEGETK